MGRDDVRPPLYEADGVLEVTVTDVDRLEALGGGLFRFVCTTPRVFDGNEERRVNLYLNATPGAIVRGIGLIFTKIPGMRILFGSTLPAATEDIVERMADDGHDTRH
jgi:hypothetical protein